MLSRFVIFIFALLLTACGTSQSEQSLAESEKLQNVEEGQGNGRAPHPVQLVVRRFLKRSTKICQVISIGTTKSGQKSWRGNSASLLRSSCAPY